MNEHIKEIVKNKLEKSKQQIQEHGSRIKFHLEMLRVTKERIKKIQKEIDEYEEFLGIQTEPKKFYPNPLQGTHHLPYSPDVIATFAADVSDKELEAFHKGLLAMYKSLRLQKETE